MLFCSSFSARDWKMYLNALWKDERGWGRASEYVLKVAYFTKEGASGGDTEAGPETPDETTDDSDDFVTKELWERMSEMRI